jgi:hypothetical protein
MARRDTADREAWKRQLQLDNGIPTPRWRLFPKYKETHLIAKRPNASPAQPSNGAA